VTFVVLIWMSPYDETELKCFGSLEKALDFAAEAKDPVNDSGGQIQVWAWTGRRQIGIGCLGWLQAKAGRHSFAKQWMKARA